MIGAEGVLETGVGRAGIDQEGVADLADVAQPLHGRVSSASSAGRSSRMLSQRGSRMTSSSLWSAMGKAATPSADTRSGRHSECVDGPSGRHPSSHVGPPRHVRRHMRRDSSKFSRNMRASLRPARRRRRGRSRCARLSTLGRHVGHLARNLEAENGIARERGAVERAGERGRTIARVCHSFIRLPVP